MSIAKELLNIRSVCKHKSYELVHLGYGEWTVHPEKSAKFFYCPGCLVTEVELIELNQESVERLLSLKLGAGFDFQIPSGVSLPEHMGSFRHVVRSLQDVIRDEIGELPKHLHLKVSPEVMGYVELVVDKNDHATTRINGTPLLYSTQLDSDSCFLMYGHHIICEIAMMNPPFQRPGKQTDLFKPYDVVRM